MASCFFVRSAWAAFQGFRCLAREFPCKLRNRRTGRGFEGYLTTTCCDDGLQSEWQRSILMPSSSHWFPQNVPMNLYLMQAPIAIGGPHRWQVGQKPCSEISCQIPNLLSAKLCRENFVSIRRNTSCFDCYILWFFAISACFSDCFCCTRDWCFQAGEPPSIWRCHGARAPNLLRSFPLLSFCCQVCISNVPSELKVGRIWPESPHLLGDDLLICFVWNYVVRGRIQLGCALREKMLMLPTVFFVLKCSAFFLCILFAAKDLQPGWGLWTYPQTLHAFFMGKSAYAARSFVLGCWKQMECLVMHAQAVLKSLRIFFEVWP